jgi:hypothetical protein
MFQPATEIFYVKQAEETGPKDKDYTGLEILYWGKNADKVYKNRCKKDIFVYSYKTLFCYIHICVLLNVLLKLLEVEVKALPIH